LSSTGIVLAYTELYEVERGWRDLKAATTTRLRPIYRRRDDRIRSHVQICWLARLLIRTIEKVRGDTWRNVRNGGGFVLIHEAPFMNSAGPKPFAREMRGLIREAPNRAGIGLFRLARIGKL
jgi:hypothetical protein